MKIYQTFNPAHPTVGEILRNAATVLDTHTPTLDNTLENLAKNDHFDVDTIIDAMDQVFQSPFTYEGEEYENIYNRPCDQIIEQSKVTFMDRYIGLMQATPAKFLSQQEILAGMTELFALILFEKLAWILADNSLVMMMKESERPIASAFDWLGKKHEFSQNLNTKRWSNGEFTPKAKVLFKELDEILKTLKLDKKELYKCKEVFFVAMVLQTVQDLSKETFDIHPFLKNWNGDPQPSFSKNKPLYFDQVQVMLARIFEAREYTEYALKGMVGKSKVLANYKQLKREIESMGLQSQVGVYIDYLIARWQVDSGKFDEALNTCKKFVPTAFYYDRDEFIDEIYQIAISLACFMGDRPFAKNLKNYAILFGLTGDIDFGPLGLKNSKANKESRSADHILEDWEVTLYAKNFVKRFNGEIFERTLFYQQRKEELESRQDDSAILLIDETTLKEPNLQKPNIKVYSCGKEITQLHHFAGFADHRTVRQLIEAGANTNKLSSSGDSALLISMQAMIPIEPYFNPKDGLETFRLLASQKNDKVINVPTNKQRYTCLGFAVSTCNYEVVKTILDLGADVDQLHSVDAVSPLYKAITLWNSYKRKPELDLDDPTVLEGIRRGNPMFRNMTASEIRKYRQSLPKNTKTWEMFTERMKQVYSKDGFLKIIELLLENGADCNLPHRAHKTLDGYTPLMLAAEFNAIDVFKLMVEKYHGNPKQQCRSIRKDGWIQDIDCYEIARYWGSTDVLEYLT